MIAMIAAGPDHVEATIGTTGDPTEDLSVKTHTVMDVAAAAARVSLIGREAL
jgi:hypothetical protein